MEMCFILAVPEIALLTVRGWFYKTSATVIPNIYVCLFIVRVAHGCPQLITFSNNFWLASKLFQAYARTPEQPPTAAWPQHSRRAPLEFMRCFSFQFLSAVFISPNVFPPFCLAVTVRYHFYLLVGCFPTAAFVKKACAVSLRTSAKTL